MGAASRLLRYGQTDGAGITALFFSAGEFPPAHIYSDQEAMHSVSPDEVTRLVKKMGGSNPDIPF